MQTVFSVNIMSFATTSCQMRIEGVGYIIFKLVSHSFLAVAPLITVRNLQCILQTLTPFVTKPFNVCTFGESDEAVFDSKVAHMMDEVFSLLLEICYSLVA